MVSEKQGYDLQTDTCLPTQILQPQKSDRPLMQENLTTNQKPTESLASSSAEIELLFATSLTKKIGLCVKLAGNGHMKPVQISGIYINITVTIVFHSSVCKQKKKEIKLCTYIIPVCVLFLFCRLTILFFLLFSEVYFVFVRSVNKVLFNTSVVLITHLYGPYYTILVHIIQFKKNINNFFLKHNLNESNVDTHNVRTSLILHFYTSYSDFLLFSLNSYSTSFPYLKKSAEIKPAQNLQTIMARGLFEL